MRVALEGRLALVRIVASGLCLVGFLSGCADPGASAQSRSTPPIAGYRWRVIGVVRHGEPVPAPAFRGAWITFGNGGTLTAYDTVDRYHLRYAVTPSGFDTIGNFSGAGWTTDRNTVSVSQAFSGLFGARHVHVSGHGSHVRFAAPGYALRLVRGNTVD